MVEAENQATTCGIDPCDLSIHRVINRAPTESISLGRVNLRWFSRPASTKASDGVCGLGVLSGAGVVEEEIGTEQRFLFVHKLTGVKVKMSP